MSSEAMSQALKLSVQFAKLELIDAAARGHDDSHFLLTHAGCDLAVQIISEQRRKLDQWGGKAYQLSEKQIGVIYRVFESVEHDNEVVRRAVKAAGIPLDAPFEPSIERATDKAAALFFPQYGRDAVYTHLVKVLVKERELKRAEALKSLESAQPPMEALMSLPVTPETLDALDARTPDLIVGMSIAAEPQLFALSVLCAELPPTTITAEELAAVTAASSAEWDAAMQDDDFDVLSLVEAYKEGDCSRYPATGKLARMRAQFRAQQYD